jgi:N-acetylglucosaminyldiphosphoundecaprenol N-acetyl-beta-D-mannosaminyltransferase
LLLGYRVHPGTGDCVDSILEQVAAGTGTKWLACINPHSYAVALKDTAFRAALHDADWLIPDGIGIVYASRILGADVAHRLTGPDVFEAVHAGLGRQGGGRVFLLGAAEETLELIRARLAKEHPRVTVCGSYSPPYRAEFTAADSAAMIEAVNAARPDVLWVAFTAPKQEKWIHAHRDRLQVPFIGAVGAAFDFYARLVQRPPRVFQRMGLDWMVRLAQEPRRLWRRSFVSAPIFAGHVLRERFARNDDHGNGGSSPVRADMAHRGDGDRQ